MERVEWQPDEDEATYQRRRDLARANYFMLERGHDEDDSGFRQRLDDMTAKLREKSHSWAESARSTGGSAIDAGSGAVTKATTTARQAFGSNPLIGGLIAAAAGAIFGTALPITRTEEENLSDLGESARGIIGEQKDKLVSVAREKKDELIAKVEDAAQSSENSSAGTQSSPDNTVSANPEPALG
jgi:hypothetical protein